MKSNYIEELKNDLDHAIRNHYSLNRLSLSEIEEIKDFMIAKILTREKELYIAMEGKKVSVPKESDDNIYNELQHSKNIAISNCQALLIKEEKNI